MKNFENIQTFGFSIFILLGMLLPVNSMAQLPSPIAVYNTETDYMTLSVDAGELGIYDISMALTSNQEPFTFVLSKVTPRSETFAGISTFAENTLSIPIVQVGDDNYIVEMSKMNEFSWEFTVTNAIHCSGNGNEASANSEFRSCYFDNVPNGFAAMHDSAETPEGGGPFYPGVMKVFDRNHDGFQDLLYVTSSFRWGYTGYGRSYGVINYWENTGLGSFQNRTDEIFGGHSIEVQTRKIRFRDINSDGIEDILFSNSLEDGRLISEDGINHNIESANLVFISQPDGTYDHVMVGIPAWTHHAEIFDIDDDGVLEVIDGNYTQGNRVYDLQPNGDWVETTTDFPNVGEVFNGSDMVIADFSGDDCLDSISTRVWPDGTERSYYVGDCSGGFTLVEHFPFVSSTFLMPGEAWNGDLFDFSVAEIGGDLYVGLYNYWSHAADFDDDGDLDLLYAVQTSLVTEEEKANNFYVDDGLNDEINHLLLLRNNNGILEKVTAIPGGLPVDMSLYFAQIIDINSDGYVDLVIDDASGWRNNYDLNDVIFYNKGDGTFEQNSLSLATGERVDFLRSVVPLDYDNDGLMDFILRTPCTSNCIKDSIMLLKGRLPLPKH